MNEVDRLLLQNEFLNDMFLIGAGELGKSVLDKLTEWKFFDMPASTKYHGTKEGDLFRHSKEVANQLLKITKACGVEWQNPRSPFVIGYFHDLCKCDAYKRPIIGTTLGGQPVESTHEWEYTKDTLLKGHGDKSVMLASTLCRLTEEEMLCIRYHMGAYQTDDWQGFDRAIRKYPTVLWTHQADMLASKVYGV